MDTLVTRNKVQYDCCPEPYPDVTFAFKLQRRSPMYRYYVLYLKILSSEMDPAQIRLIL
jgi:hypothetical protein